MEEEHGGDEGLLADSRNDKDKITLVSVKERLRKIKGNKEDEEEQKILEAYLKRSDTLADLNKKIKEQQKALEIKVWDQYKSLSDDDIKTIVVDDKWIKLMDNAIHTEMQRISQRLTQRIKELADRYDTPLPIILDEVGKLEKKVNTHLAEMGFEWS